MCRGITPQAQTIVLPLHIFGFCDLHPSEAVIWGNGSEDTGQILYSKVLNVFPGVFPGRISRAMSMQPRAGKQPIVGD